jgi:hypothetical protein
MRQRKRKGSVMLRKLWNKLFYKEPLFRKEEISFMEQKIEILCYNKKRLSEVFEKAPHGSMVFVSDKTYIIIGHFSDLLKDDIDKHLGQSCNENCEYCAEV